MTLTRNKPPQDTGVLLHDYFAQYDGGGKLALTLARHLRWPLVAGSVSPAVAIDEDWQDVSVHVLGAAASRPLVRIAQQARRWSLYTGEHRTVVYSGYYTPLAANRIDTRRSVYYCNTPPRFLYDQKRFWMDQLPLAARPLARGFLHWYQPRYEAAVEGMDVVVANSETVRRRIEQHLGCRSEVVYPPCDTTAFRWAPSEGYYLSTARLDPIKRIDRIIDAFKQMGDKKLVVTSDGPLRDALRERAGGASNIEFTGAVDANRLRDLLARCIATVYVPVEEDFGLSVVESLASGKPVISVNEGGVTETLEHDETGILLSPTACPDEISSAVRRLTPARAHSMKSACQRRARLFGVSTFTEKMSRIVDATAP